MSRLPFVVLSLGAALVLSGCPDAPVQAPPSSSKTASPAASPTASSTPAAAASPQETYAAYVAAIRAKAPLEELAQYQTAELAAKGRKQIESAKDPKKMLELFYRISIEQADAQAAEPSEAKVDGDQAVLRYPGKDAQGQEFTTKVTLRRAGGTWKVVEEEVEF